jgi:nucleotide-binding universal stress UspA family protein
MRMLDSNPALKVLVVALDAAEPPSLTADSVLVIAPAVNSRLRRWLSDEDGARRRAEERLETYVERLERAGRDVSGSVGDADPVLAIADALAIFAADEILVAANTESSRRLAREVVKRARGRYALPIAVAGAGMPHVAPPASREYPRLHGVLA